MTGDFFVVLHVKGFPLVSERYLVLRKELVMVEKSVPFVPIHCTETKYKHFFKSKGYILTSVRC